jgi:hypothetical protein
VSTQNLLHRYSLATGARVHVVARLLALDAGFPLSSFLLDPR